MSGVGPRVGPAAYEIGGSVDAPRSGESLAAELQVTRAAVWKAVERACLTGDFKPHPTALCELCAFRPWCPAFGGDPLRARADLETDEAIYSFAVDRILEIGDWLSAGEAQAVVDRAQDLPLAWSTSGPGGGLMVVALGYYEIAAEVFGSVAHLLNLDLDIVFVDTTSTYWETETADDDLERRSRHARPPRFVDHAGQPGGEGGAVEV